MRIPEWGEAAPPTAQELEFAARSALLNSADMPSVHKFLAMGVVSSKIMSEMEKTLQMEEGSLRSLRHACNSRARSAPHGHTTCHPQRSGRRPVPP